jgi:hypothetical protein
MAQICGSMGANGSSHPATTTRMTIHAEIRSPADGFACRASHRSPGAATWSPDGKRVSDGGDRRVRTSPRGSSGWVGRCFAFMARPVRLSETRSWPRTRGRRVDPCSSEIVRFVLPGSSRRTPDPGSARRRAVLPSPVVRQENAGSQWDHLLTSAHRLVVTRRWRVVASRSLGPFESKDGSAAAAIPYAGLRTLATIET